MKAQRRNRSMVQNADSAFAYYGQDLARRVATVPVGAPDTAITSRKFTSDTQQPIRESFVHGVAALCCLHHFVDRDARPPGLLPGGGRGPDAARRRQPPSRRRGGRHDSEPRQPDGRRSPTCSTCVGRTLIRSQASGVLRVVPAILEEAARLGAPVRVGPALHRLVAEYREHLAWMKDVLGTEPEPDPSLTREALSRERLATHRIEPSAGSDVADEDAAALALLHWTADWIRDFSRGEGAAALVVQPARAARGGYWPRLVGDDGRNVAAEKPGELTQVPDQDIQSTVRGFIREENIAQNGWPDPMAAADHFRYAIEQGHPTERRQLEMLLAGVVMSKLALRDIATRADPPLLSLEHLVDECRKKHLPEFARVAVVHEHRDGDIVLGFNSPHTLLCPTPIGIDERHEGAWGALWQALTGSERPRDWRTEEVGEWRPASVAVRQIRTWIEEEKRAHGSVAPPWTHLFVDDSASAAATFGRGRTLSVYWGTGAEAVRVTVALPTAASGDYWPDEQTVLVDETALLAGAPALRSVTTDGGVTFRMVEFTLPDRRAPARALWREHLDHLQRRGDIAAFGTRSGDHKLAVLTADRRSAAMLENVVLLDRDDMMVGDCTPMRQEPVPGSSTRPGRVQYPDYPLRSDYLGLVETDDGARVVDLLKRGEPVRVKPPTIDETRRQATGRGPSATGSPDWLTKGSAHAASTVRSAVSAGQRVGRAVREGEDLASIGRGVVEALWSGEPSREGSSRANETRRPSAKATWELRLAGRSDVLPITLQVPPADAADDEDQHHRAHWMVWPRFRSKPGEERYWRAYYVYEHCTDARLRLSTLWLDPDDDRVRRRRPPKRAGAHPVSFHAGDQREHTGGPPVAFSLQNAESGQELGLYVLNLEPLGRRQADVKVGLDFGTSHTVAAVQADGEKHLVKLAPELDPARNEPLGLHVSENWSHVTDTVEGLKRLGVWLPTYTDEPTPKEREGLLPSELLTISPLVNLSGDDPSRWQPGSDYVIPFMDMQRRDLADHLLADFKWTASSKAFRGREDVLREIYLGMAMELVMADVVWRRLRAFPARVDFTFTYPLRDSPEQVRDYARTLRRVIRSGARSLGGEFQLTDDIGIYNESSAARGGTRVFGEVCLVGDLGGGTLDLFISAEPGPGIEFEEVADSAKLGGNELLRTMAEHPDLFLPSGLGQPVPATSRRSCAPGMRSKGSALLFGGGGEAEHHAGLDVTGFAQAGAAKVARALIERYFRLIVEYMARRPRGLSRPPLVFPGAGGPPRRSRQAAPSWCSFGGNGWRLWPDSLTYPEIERKMAEDVAARAGELWRDRAGDRDVLAWAG